MLIALMCIIFIPAMQVQAKDLGPDDIVAVWVDTTGNEIEIYKEGEKYFAKYIGVNDDSNKKVDDVVFEDCIFRGDDWKSTRYYDKEGKRHTCWITFPDPNDKNKVKVRTRRWFLGGNKTTHWTKKDSN